MKAKKTNPPDQPNILDIVYKFMAKLALDFRDTMGAECDWSTPTFYRKMKHAKSINKAERDMIYKIVQEKADDFREWVHDLRKFHR
ncbi:hypothetical protein F0L74_16650 [Chitinophaga agrisoli]|uniref:Uncharacterized protein n=1 Tax=Chitinophaga agrisoli TaxID=2607653 RepID=A0A5B2VRR5_9BACT|nr:hypothetical protein [Chitinophaga agrisoli]KAA2241524.1 hypothetical protein F0L74_16650 [Chitinophaga agrisoli]